MILYMKNKIKQSKCGWSGHGDMEQIDIVNYTDVYDGIQHEVHVFQCKSCQKYKLHVYTDKGERYQIWS